MLPVDDDVPRRPDSSPGDRSKTARKDAGVVHSPPGSTLLDTTQPPSPGDPNMVPLPERPSERLNPSLRPTPTVRTPLWAFVQRRPCIKHSGGCFDPLLQSSPHCILAGARLSVERGARISPRFWQIEGRDPLRLASIDNSASTEPVSPTLLSVVVSETCYLACHAKFSDSLIIRGGALRYHCHV